MKSFEDLFYDDVIHRVDSYLRPNEELKVKAEDLRLTLMTFWNLTVKGFLENEVIN